MDNDGRVSQVLAYVIKEGFELYDWADCVTLLLGDKACFSWAIENYSHIEMVLTMYATLVEPPLLYN